MGGEGGIGGMGGMGGRGGEGGVGGGMMGGEPARLLASIGIMESEPEVFSCPVPEDEEGMLVFLGALREEHASKRAAIAELSASNRSMAALVRHLTRKFNLVAQALPETPYMAKAEDSDADALVGAHDSDEDDGSTLPGRPTQILMKGYVNKKGRRVRNWKRRYFVLRGGTLSYYTDDTCTARKGKMHLTECEIDGLRERDETGRACLALAAHGRTLFFQSDEPKENTAWFLAISCMKQQLEYSRLIRESGDAADLRILEFFSHPMRHKFALDGRVVPLFALDALNASVRFHSMLHVLSMEDAGLSDEHLIRLADAVGPNKSLGVLRLASNAFTASGLEALTGALRQNKTVTEVYLENCGLDDACALLLAQILPSTRHIGVLSLGDNRISDSGAEALATALARPHRMATIALDGNAIGDLGGAALGRMLEANPTVINVELRNNAMTSQGTLAILQSVATPSCSVSRIALSGNGYDVGEIAGAVLAIAQTAPHIIHVDVAPYLLEESALGMLRLLPL